MKRMAGSDPAITAPKAPIAAVGYLRTSSARNVGRDKDSEPRQRAAIERYAKAAGFVIVDWFNDPAVSGRDPIEARPGFAALLDRIEDNGVRVVLVEDASRFARELMVQEAGIVVLQKRGVGLLTSSGDDLAEESADPTRKLMRQIVGAVIEFEKARLVARLRRAREVKGKLGGRKPFAVLAPDAVKLAKQLRRRPRKGAPMSLREIAAELAKRGHLSARGTTYSASAVLSMLGG